jgi:TolA-binding protein
VTLVIELALLVPAFASAQPGSNLSRFQEPTEERRIDAPEAEQREQQRDDDEDLPENLEDRLYLRERADNLGEAARNHRNALLNRLLAEREEWVRVRRRDAIQLLETFVREEPERAPEMADALLRLAELKWEQAREDYLRAFAAWQEVPEDNRGTEPRPDYRASMVLYDRILRHHRGFERYDFVLYMKAYALVELGQPEQALEQYRRILAEFPESRFTPDAHMALAETIFATYNYEGALAEYENVIRHPESGLYGVALFKSAWCLWRMGRTQDAALRFRQVLDLGRNRERMSGDERRRLRELQDEALNYLIQVFVEDESNTARDVFAFLEEIGGEQYAHRVLERLSETYFGQARYERGIEAYQLLLEMDPSSRDAVQWQMEIATGYAMVGSRQQTIQAMRTLAETYGPGTQWARQQGDPAVAQRAANLGERTIRRQALQWHEEGQRENQRRLLEDATALYDVYLSKYGRSRAAYQINFYRGEILFHRLERYAEAGDSYLAAARINPRGELTRDALYNAIGAFEHVREDELQRCAPANGNGSNPPRPQQQQNPPRPQQQQNNPTPEQQQAEQPHGETPRCGESDNDRKFSEAIELYVELFPNDPDLPEILFRQGRLYYDRRIYDPAVRLFGQLLERFPQSRFAAPAGELILDSFNRAQDYANIEQWARRLKTAPAFQNADAQRRLNGLIIQAVFKVGEQLAQRGQHREAADAYFRAAEEFPNDPRAKEAYSNAGVERQRAGDLAGAAEAYDRLIERFPGDRIAADGCWRAAQMYESIAQFREAARYYETYSERFPQGEHSADAAYNAVLLRVTAGDNDAGVAAGRRFIERYPRHESVNEVYFFIGRAQEAAEDFDDAAATYRNFTQRTRDLDLQVEATTRLAQVLIRDGQRQAGDRALEDAVRIGKRNQSRLQQGLYYAAQARYMQGDQVLAEFEAIPLDGEISTLRDRLQRKAQLLQRAATIYADVVSFNVAEWVTAALFQIGRSYELFATALRDRPVPEGLSEEEEQAYLDQLAEFIVPMEDQALQAFEGGYQRAIELRIFNRWTASLFEALTRLNDVQYPPIRELGLTIVDSVPLPQPRPLLELRRGPASEEVEIRETTTPPAEGENANRPANAPEGDS